MPGDRIEWREAPLAPLWEGGTLAAQLEEVDALSHRSALSGSTSTRTASPR